MMDKESKIQTIFQSVNLEKIYMAHNILENHGIISNIKNEFRPYNIGCIELEVYTKDIQNALQILRTLYPEEFEKHFICPYCKSENICVWSDKTNRIAKQLHIIWKKIKYMQTHQTPKGTFYCRDCKQEFDLE